RLGSCCRGVPCTGSAVTLSHTRAKDCLHVPRGLQGGMGAVGSLSGLLWRGLVQRAASWSCRLHTCHRLADCHRASLTRLYRQAYARLYPVLLVKQDGATIHIRYREPRRMLAMPVDLDCLSPEERRARFRKREAKFREKKEEPELKDNFDMERYRRFWAKK
ncbi:large ribosomal subunit protein mL55, partial [Dugong dugon]